MKTDKKNYIEEHEEWQRHQFDLGYFTGGRIPVWIKYPGKRKRLGAIFLIMGLVLCGQCGWTVFNIMRLSEVQQTTGQIVSAIILGFLSIVFLWAGIKLIKRSKKK